MTAPAAYRVGVHQLDHRCWLLTHAQDVTDGWVYTAHYDTQAEAADAGPVPCCFGEPERTNVVTTLWHADTRCWVATAVCGYAFDVDSDTELHFDDREELLEALVYAGWASAAGGRLCCPDPLCLPCLTAKAVA